MTGVGGRRTQAQRRDATINALLEATVVCLAERGYAGTSTSAICARAGVSQGALFRHFPTRQALLVATADLASRRNIEAARGLLRFDLAGVEGLTDALLHLREVVLSPTNQTWRELLVAARSDADLRAALRPARLDFQRQMLALAREMWRDHLPADEVAPVLSIVVNVLDGFAFSALDPAPTAAPGRTVRGALAVLAQMIVDRYPDPPADAPNDPTAPNAPNAPTAPTAPEETR
ncbi:TetR family transcriptional regulator [Nocardioides sp. YIM 152588]|uniref:TetR/AcrR family transcriptional regulator n=1 Tax=Nocardioides sp. YIM 152588 TaxID=3158259 RepID=UPI0032E4B47D